jgi:hypothetical protein
LALEVVFLKTSMEIVFILKESAHSIEDKATSGEKGFSRLFEVVP